MGMRVVDEDKVGVFVAVAVGVAVAVLVAVGVALGVNVAQGVRVGGGVVAVAVGPCFAPKSAGR